MSIGTGVALVVIGAILYFAVHVSVAGIDIRTVGLILMAAGAIVFVVGLILLFSRRRAVSVSRSSVDPATGARVERRDVDGGPLV
jgi:Zn-dependent protease with chaperone function